MKTKIVAAALVVLGCALPAYAQDPRVEIGATIGWTFSDGVSSDTAIPTQDGEIYNRVDPKDSVSWGFNVGGYVNPNVEAGFIFGQQLSSLLLDGTKQRELGDMTVNTYHGYFAYNFFDSDMKVRPYAFFGLGATSYGSVDFKTLAGANKTVDGMTKFSTTWGAGIKAAVSPRVGIKGGIQLTPTYIKSDAEGWWCDPWYGCYVVGDVQYSSQWTLNGGLFVRF